MVDLHVASDMIGIRQVLADLTYPAHRWRLVAEAQHYGAPAASVVRLIGLPVRSYDSIEEVERFLRRAGHPVTHPAAHPAAHPAGADLAGRFGGRSAARVA